MSEPVIRTVLRMRARQGLEAEFQSAWARAAAEISRVPGNVRQELSRDLDDSRTFVITSEWIDRAAVDAFGRSDQREALTAGLRGSARGGGQEHVRAAEHRPGDEAAADPHRSDDQGQPGRGGGIRARLPDRHVPAGGHARPGTRGTAQGAGIVRLPHLRRMGIRAGFHQLGRGSVARRPKWPAGPVVVRRIRAAGVRDPLPPSSAQTDPGHAGVPCGATLLRTAGHRRAGDRTAPVVPLRRHCGRRSGNTSPAAAVAVPRGSTCRPSQPPRRQHPRADSATPNGSRNKRCRRAGGRRRAQWD